MNTKEMQEFIELYQAFKGANTVTKEAGTSNAAQLLFGNTGLFTTQGLESDIITAYVRPDGISGYLAANNLIFPSVLEQPVLGLITGIQDNGAAAVSAPCDDAPTGYIKGCNLFTQFGRLQFDTATIEFDKIFTQLNSGVNTDLRLHGRLLGLSEADYPKGLDEASVVNIVVGSEMVKVGMLMARGTINQMGLTEQNWQGTPAQASAGGGYVPYVGLDAQITTGHIDAVTQTTCPAVDSDVKDFGYMSIAAQTAAGTPQIVRYISMLEEYLYHNDRRTGLDPVKRIAVMRAELWSELTQYWPIAYNTNRGAEILSANVNMTMDATDMTAQRDVMRSQLRMAINGRMYDVVVDDGIFENTNANNANVPAGSFASSFYLVPITINGGFPVTYIEYKDYRVGMQQLQEFLGKQTFWTDGGTFSWATDPIKKWCFKLSAKTERRIVCRTPHLAGKIEHILYSPLQHLRDNLPNSPYPANGGVSTRAASSLHAVWGSSRGQ